MVCIGFAYYVDMVSDLLEQLQSLILQFLNLLELVLSRIQC
jgi:hypothetical protein